VHTASRLVLVVAAASAAAIAAVAGPAAAAQSTVSYVALGDSYAAGVGAGDYISSSGSCDRSPNAYSALWATANDPASYVSVACGGATVDTVMSGQLSALSSSTTLVSVTVGGADADFESVMVTCDILFFVTSTCVSAIDNAEAGFEASLPGKLGNLLSEIRMDAPNATVVVLDYPDFYDLSQSSCAVLTATDRTDINDGINLLDGLIQTAASQADDVFADVRPAFAGHEICDTGSWLNSVDWTDITSSYHPTPDGYADGYLPVFTAAVNAAFTS
jgi:lysophospholipase L1-like esterase